MMEEDLETKLQCLVELLPSNCYSTVCKLRKMTSFRDIDDSIDDKLISECDHASVINKEILSYLLRKTSDDIIKLCESLQDLVTADQKEQLCKLKIEWSAVLSTTNSVDPCITTECSKANEDFVMVSSPSLKSCILLEPSSSTSFSCDKILIHTSVEVLCAQNLLTYNEVVDIIIADDQTKKKLLDDKFNALLKSFSIDKCSGLPDCHTTCDLSNLPAVLTSNDETTSLPFEFAVEETCPPRNIVLNKGFTSLHTRYHSILQLMSDNYEQSVGKLLNYISDDQICMILDSSNSTAANKIILDCLIERMSCREELFDLCCQLETITTSKQLMMLISGIRSELLEALFSLPPIVTTDISLLPNNSISSSSGSHHPATLHQITNNSSGGTDSTPVISTPIASQPTQRNVSSQIEVREQLNYEYNRLKKGIKCPPPPPLPPNYVCRQHLLEEMVSKLCQSTIDPNSYGTSLTVTGAGGFGKTSVVTALCHHPMIKEQFTDGVVLMELGPQATDPNMKLKGLYNLLTDDSCDVNVVEQQINQLTSLYCRNLLVIIDDVWHVEDAEPIVKAFSNCKIVLTTRMNDIEQYIPTKQVVSVGPMEPSEAISLLACKVIDISQLSQEDVSLLDELAQDVHLWPLLLSLVRGQLSHSLKQRKLCYHDAIYSAQAKLHDKGLIAFDKNNIERSRKYAVKSCIEVTLELLTKSLSNKMKKLIIYNGIGISLQTAVLHNLWNITELEASNTVDVLWGYGLVQYTDTALPPYNNRQHCVEVHAVISQYIIECMDSLEVLNLSPFGGGLDTITSLSDGLHQEFLKCSAVHVHDTLTMTAIDYLKFKLSEIENLLLPFSLKKINVQTLADPHHAILMLQGIKDDLLASPNITTFYPTLNDEIKSLINDCHKIIKDVHKLSRTLNQKVQQCLTQSNYHNLIETVYTYSNKYPIAMVAQRAVTMVMKIISHCDGKVGDNIMKKFELLKMITPDYHFIALQILPYVQLYSKELQQIHTSLQAGSPDVEATQQYFLFGQHDEEIVLLKANYLIKLQEVAPNFVATRSIH